MISEDLHQAYLRLMAYVVQSTDFMKFKIIKAGAIPRPS